jgi:hypothetical protein
MVTLPGGTFLKALNDGSELVDVASLGTTVFANFGPELPNGTLRVAYQQRESGKLSESVHHVGLSCWDGRCDLTTPTGSRRSVVEL